MIIAQHLDATGVRARVLYWEDIVITIFDGKVSMLAEGVDIFEDQIDLALAFGWYKNGDKSIYRDIAFSVGLILEKRGIPCWNSEMIQQRSTTKLSCMVQLALSAVPVPDTVFALHPTTDTINYPYPMIVKAVAASRGNDNYLVNDADHLRELLQNSQNYLVQRFLPNDHDLRVICFGGKPSLVLKRSRQDKEATHLNNTSQGGNAEWVELTTVPEGILTESHRICIIMKREMAGIDFIPDESSPIGYRCLEVNAIPQLTSGMDIDIKMTALTRAIAEE